MSSSGPSTGLAVNVDVANGTFWTSQDVCQAARNLCKERNPHLSYQTFRDLLRPRQGANTGGRLVKSDDFMSLQKMKKLRFTVKHQGKQSGKLSLMSVMVLAKMHMQTRRSISLRALPLAPSQCITRTARMHLTLPSPQSHLRKTLSRSPSLSSSISEANTMSTLLCHGFL